jgi:small subunit ribosomal protein S6
MNIECGQEVLDELLSAFKFNDAVLRHLVIRRDEAVTEPSPLAKSAEQEADAKPARFAADEDVDDDDEDLDVGSDDEVDALRSAV